MAIHKYHYKFNEKILITKFTAISILNAIKLNKEQVKVSLDLGLTREPIKISHENVLIGKCRIPLSHLNEILDDDGVFIVECGKIIKIAFYSNGKYYKLKCVAENTAPTLEISGIHMHRIKDTTPWKDTLMKIKAARIRRGLKVLDICTGLGYTAIASIQKGASSVLTIEKDENVLKIASYNPWSRKLEDKRIEIILGDAVNVITELESESFDRIIHDPPRFALAGELYSRDFYQELYRVLKRNGILYHYTGQPGIKRGFSIIQGVARRLREAGFSLTINRSILGIIAFK